jgi:hypothetical protein
VRFNSSISFFEPAFDSLELPEDVDGEQEGHQADGVADEVDCGGQFHLGTF